MSVVTVRGSGRLLNPAAARGSAAVQLPFRIKALYGLGQSAESVKNTALTSVLLFYYSQVLGLPATLTGVALMVAVLVDGVADLVIGSLSDSLRHRWGRRHPPMYAAILPVALSFIALFMPPHALGQRGLFAWLIVMSLLCRNFMSLYVVPYTALGAELSGDHHERTVIVACQSFFHGVGSALVFLVGIAVLRPSARYPVGQLDPTHYPSLGLLLGGFMLVAALTSALSTHRVVARLAPTAATDVARFSFNRLFKDVVSIFGLKSYAIFFLMIFLWSVGLIFKMSMDIYMGTYFWRLQKSLVFLLPLTSLLAMLVATPFWPLLSRALGKKQAFSVGVCIYALGAMLPLAKILGVMPSSSSPSYAPLIFAAAALTGPGLATSSVLAGSMLADVTDEYRLKYGRRIEGVFFGVSGAMSKVTMAISPLTAGLVLSFVGLKVKAAPAAVPLAVSTKLGIVVTAILILMAAAALLVVRLYPIDSRRHAELREALDGAALQDAA